MENSLNMTISDLAVKTNSKDGTISTVVSFTTHLNPVAIGALARLQEIGYLHCEIGTSQATMFDGKPEGADEGTSEAEAAEVIKLLEGANKTTINKDGEKVDITDAEFKKKSRKENK